MKQEKSLFWRLFDKIFFSEKYEKAIRFCKKSKDNKHEIDWEPYLNEYGNEYYMCLKCGAEILYHDK